MSALAPRYTPDLAGRILQELGKGRYMVDICKDPGMPAYSSVALWIANDHEGFAARCREARAAGGAPMGGHTHYTPELGDQIAARVTSGRTLADVCTDPDMPLLCTVRQWISMNRDDFATRYRAAQEIGLAMSGREVRYSAAIADRILAGLMAGHTLVGICKEPGMPSEAAVLLWVKHDREGFRARYYEARDIGNQLLADELIEIGRDSSKDRIQRRGKDGEIEEVIDHDHINRARLHSDNLKWTLSRVLPNTYGNRVNVNATHNAGEGWAELLKSVNNKSRGLPNQYRLPDDDGDGDA